MAAKVKKKLRNVPSLLPKTDQENKFCELWLLYADATRAGKEVGWSASRSRDTERRFAEYLARLQVEKEKELAKKSVVGVKEILAELLALGMANPQDYIEQYTEKTSEGVEVIKYRQRDLMTLSRHQAAAISAVKFNADGTITYRLPNRREKLPGLIAAGRHLGMFHEKLIQEHRHLHLHSKAPDIRGADPALLKRMEDDMVKLVGVEQAKQVLGYIEGEYEDVSES